MCVSDLHLEEQHNLSTNLDQMRRHQEMLHLYTDLCMTNITINILTYKDLTIECSFHCFAICLHCTS